jgi:hypothetical protein
MDSYRNEAERREGNKYSPLKMLAAVMCFELMANMAGNMMEGLAVGAAGMGQALGNAGEGAGNAAATAVAAPLAPRAAPAPQLGLNLSPKFNMSGMDWGS